MYYYYVTEQGPALHDKQWFIDRNLKLHSYVFGKLQVTGSDIIIDVPPMTTEDWNRFIMYTEFHPSADLLTLDQLVERFEQVHPKITWYEEDKS